MKTESHANANASPSLAPVPARNANGFYWENLYIVSLKQSPKWHKYIVDTIGALFLFLVCSYLAYSYISEWSQPSAFMQIEKPDILQQYSMIAPGKQWGG